MSVKTPQPIVGQDMQQHAKPLAASEILIVQSKNLRGKKKKHKGKNNVKFP